MSAKSPTKCLIFNETRMLIPVLLDYSYLQHMSYVAEMHSMNEWIKKWIIERNQCGAPVSNKKGLFLFLSLCNG